VIDYTEDLLMKYTTLTLTVMVKVREAMKHSRKPYEKIGNSNWPDTGPYPLPKYITPMPQVSRNKYINQLPLIREVLTRRKLWELLYGD
jgi:hypothetical protein